MKTAEEWWKDWMFKNDLASKKMLTWYFELIQRDAFIAGAETMKLEAKQRVYGLGHGCNSLTTRAACYDAAATVETTPLPSFPPYKQKVVE